MTRLMIVVITAVLVATAGETALAGKLTFVEKSPNACHTEGCQYAEWRIEGLPDLRLVWSGFDDGGNGGLYRVDKKGHYIHVLDAFNAWRNHSGDVTLVEGYTKSTGLPYVLGPDGPMFWATFEHEVYELSDVTCRPAWQKRVPLILLDGEWPEAGHEKTDKLNFQLVSLKRLVALAKRSTPDWKGRVVCDGDCCAVNYPTAQQPE